MGFQTEKGLVVPAVTSEQMREIDRMAPPELSSRSCAAGLQPVDLAVAGEAIRSAKLVVDALIGYSLRGAPRERVAELIGKAYWIRLRSVVQ